MYRDDLRTKSKGDRSVGISEIDEIKTILILSEPRDTKCHPESFRTVERALSSLRYRHGLRNYLDYFGNWHIQICIKLISGKASQMIDDLKPESGDFLTYMR